MSQPPTKSRLLLLAFRLLFAIACIIAAITMRVVVAGELEIAKSTDALLAGDPHEAVIRARRAAGWYAPGAPHVRVAYQRLTALAVEAEARGNDAIALLAWRGIRSAALSTRWIDAPGPADLERANREIARLEAREQGPAGDGTSSAEALERERLAELARDERPRGLWVFVLSGSFLLWLVGAFWLARSGVDPTGRMLWARAWKPAAITLAGLLLWAVSLYAA